jgi:3-oxoacyl-[acyl-carrier-protein] synthase-1
MFDTEVSDASHVGRAGGLIAVGQAVATIQAGRADFVLAGGIDSFRDPYVLGTLEKERRVKSEVNLDGFIPGEGAAFLLIASAEAAAARGLVSFCSVSPVAAGFEPGHLYSAEPYRGDGLAATFAGLFAAGASPGPVGDVFSSMNGENHWAKEWGVGYLRNRAAFAPNHTIQHPADSFGDTGAACGPLMTGLAALRMRTRPTPTLVYGSSDRGPRAALVVGHAA